MTLHFLSDIPTVYWLLGALFALAAVLFATLALLNDVEEQVKQEPTKQCPRCLRLNADNRLVEAGGILQPGGCAKCEAADIQNPYQDERMAA